MTGSSHNGKWDLLALLALIFGGVVSWGTAVWLWSREKNPPDALLVLGGAIVGGIAGYLVRGRRGDG